jgi:hypothetical protein
MGGHTVGPIIRGSDDASKELNFRRPFEVVGRHDLHQAVATLAQLFLANLVRVEIGCARSAGFSLPRYY